MERWYKLCSNDRDIFHRSGELWLGDLPLRWLQQAGWREPGHHSHRSEIFPPRVPWWLWETAATTKIRIFICWIIYGPARSCLLTMEIVLRVTIFSTQNDILPINFLSGQNWWFEGFVAFQQQISRQYWSEIIAGAPGQPAVLLANSEPHSYSFQLVWLVTSSYLPLRHEVAYWQLVGCTTVVRPREACLGKRLGGFSPAADICWDELNELYFLRKYWSNVVTNRRVP